MDSPLGLRGDQLPRAGALLNIRIETLRILAVVPPLGLRLGLSGRSVQTRGGWLWLDDDTLDIGCRRACGQAAVWAFGRPRPGVPTASFQSLFRRTATPVVYSGPQFFSWKSDHECAAEGI